MTDAITLLTEDHRTVEQLFATAEAADRLDEKLVDDLVEQLSVHDGIERAHLYPVVRRHVQDGDWLVDHSVHAHTEVAERLQDLEHAERDSIEQRRLVAAVAQLVRAHVEVEETEIFPRLRAALSARDLEALGDTLAGAKRTAPTHPHPHAGRTPATSRIATAVSGLIDKARNAANRR